MPEDLGIDELFPESHPSGGEVPPPPPPPDPLSVVGERLARLEGVLTHLVMERQAPSSPAPAPPSPPPEIVPPWNDKTAFLTPADVAEIAQNPDPSQALNRAFARVGQQIYAPLASALETQRAELTRARQEADYRTVMVERTHAAQANAERFYTRYPEMREFTDLVPLEAQRLAQEAIANPGLLYGREDEAVHKILAERVRARVTGYATRLQSEETPGVSPPVAPRRSFLERGSGTRPSAVPPPKDANARALKEMNTHLRETRK